jgi:A/G-specific adenine glycosylase
VAAVVPYWERWMARFPSAAALAAAPLDDVLAGWSGLGYYSRARNLYRGAREVMARYGGQLPDSAAELCRLPGVGRYTAGAIASIAFGRREPLVDGNVARVLARLDGIESDVKSSATQRLLWQRAGELVPADAPGDFNQALMELGATICSAISPRCAACPLTGSCRARAAGRQDELPVIAPRRPDGEKPLLRAAAAWIERGGSVLLARRRPEGLFGGLWELPQAPSTGELLDLFAGRRPERRLALEPGRPVARHRQVLSHRRLAVAVYRGALAGRAPTRGAGPYDRMAWHRLASLDSLGLALASRAILAGYRETKGWTTRVKRSASSKPATSRSSRV